MRFTISLKIILCTSLLLLIGVSVGIYAAVSASSAVKISRDIQEKFIAVNTYSAKYSDSLFNVTQTVNSYITSPNEREYNIIIEQAAVMEEAAGKAADLASDPYTASLLSDSASKIIELFDKTKEYRGILMNNVEILHASEETTERYTEAAKTLERQIEMLRDSIYSHFVRANENGDSVTAGSYMANYKRSSDMLRNGLRTTAAYTLGVSSSNIESLASAVSYAADTRKMLDTLLNTLRVPEVIAIAQEIDKVLKIAEECVNKTYGVYSGMSESSARRIALSDELFALNAEVDGLTDSNVDSAAGTAATNLSRTYTASIILTIVVLAVGAGVLIFLRNSVTAPLNRFVVLVGSLTSGDGDLTKRIPANGKDELSDLAFNFNKFIENVQEIVVEVKRSADELASANNQLASTMEELASTFMSQTEQMSGIVNDMDGIKDVSLNSVTDLNTCLTIMNDSSEETDRGVSKLAEVRDSIARIHDRTDSLAETISRLSNSSAQIGDILTVINDIADQTNLLALNAAIEAARAGDAGRGFAVVADEVRKLAERTQKATSEIETIISSLVKESETASSEMAEAGNAVNAGVEVIDETSKSFEQVVSGVYKVRENTTSLVGSVTNQYDTVQAVNEKTQAVGSGIEESNAAVSEVTITVSHLQEMTEKLKSMVERFKS